MSQNTPGMSREDPSTMPKPPGHTPETTPKKLEKIEKVRKSDPQGMGFSPSGWALAQEDGL